MMTRRALHVPDGRNLDRLASAGLLKVSPALVPQFAQPGQIRKLVMGLNREAHMARENDEICGTRWDDE